METSPRLVERPLLNDITKLIKNGSKSKQIYLPSIQLWNKENDSSSKLKYILLKQSAENSHDHNHDEEASTLYQLQHGSELYQVFKLAKVSKLLTVATS
jgi:hypothetical protein